jgi:hypothetical protein
MTDYTELDRLAEALIELNKANLLDWAATIEDARIGKTHTEYALAANPAVVRTLIDELNQARNGMKYACAMRLKKEIDRLQAENVALRKDAERYQWLRDKSESVHQFYLSTPIWFTGVKFSKDNVDNTIDAAMSKEPQP